MRWPWALLVVGAAGLGALMLLALLPYRLRLSLQLRAAATGLWAVAGGVELGPLALAFVTARGISPRLSLHLFGRTLFARPLAWLVEQVRARLPKRQGPEPTIEERAASIVRAYERLEGWVDPVDLGYFLIETKRRVVIHELVVTPTFNADDAALTGQIAGALHTLSAALGPTIVIDPRPVWYGEGKADCDVRGELTLYPGLAAVDAARFARRHVRPPSARRRARGGPVPDSGGAPAGGDPPP